VPYIVVFTKYDILVMSEIQKFARGGSTEQVWLDSEERAKETFKELCINPLTKAIGKVPIMWVSSGYWVAPLFEVSCKANASLCPFAGGPRYRDTIKELIQATDKEIQKQTGVPSHTEPSSLNFSCAQRADNNLKFEASIESVFALNAFACVLKPY
jgi:hypothetical protein